MNPEFEKIGNQRCQVFGARDDVYGRKRKMDQALGEEGRHCALSVCEPAMQRLQLAPAA